MQSYLPGQEFPETKGEVTLMEAHLVVSLIGKLFIDVDSLNSHFSKRKMTLEGRPYKKIIELCSEMGLYKSPHSHQSPHSPNDGCRSNTETKQMISPHSASGVTQSCHP